MFIDIENVKVISEGEHKYIVAHVFDGFGEGTITVVRSHNELSVDAALFWLQVEVKKINPYFSARCIGGGYIDLNSHQKTIHIWDGTEELGREPDRQETVRMLQKTFPDYEIIAD